MTRYKYKYDPSISEVECLECGKTYYVGDLPFEADIMDYVETQHHCPKEDKMNNYEIKDSGKHRDFKTGARRDNKEGKGRYDLLPPFAIHALAIHYQKGCQKYGDRNWEKGIPTGEYIDSAERHINEFKMGLTDENHLIAAIWNLMCCYDTIERIGHHLLPSDLDDLPYPLRQERIKDKDDKVDWVEPTPIPDEGEGYN